MKPQLLTNLPAECGFKMVNIFFNFFLFKFVCLFVLFLFFSLLVMVYLLFIGQHLGSGCFKLKNLFSVLVINPQELFCSSKLMVFVNA